MRPPLRRPTVRRAIVLMPSGFTLANLFLGVWAIVSAARGEYERAGLYVFLGGVCDVLDGRVARATRTGSRFGEELDSLVDAVSFGVAPAMIMYFAVLNNQGWDWVFAFGFVACVVVRLARFNIEQAGRPKKAFNGLPSPAAGLTLASYYWFSQTTMYPASFLGVSWQVAMRWLMVALSALMISSVQYPAFPTIGVRTWRGIVGLVIVVGAVVGTIVAPLAFFFPALLGYVTFGLAKTVFLGLLDRRPSDDSLPEHELDAELEEDEPADEAAEVEPTAPTQPALVHGHRRRRRRRHGGQGGHDRREPGGPPAPDGDVA